MGKNKKIETREEYVKRWNINDPSAAEMVAKMLKSPILQIRKLLEVLFTKSKPTHIVIISEFFSTDFIFY